MQKCNPQCDTCYVHCDYAACALLIDDCFLRVRLGCGKDSMWYLSFSVAVTVCMGAAGTSVSKQQVCTERSAAGAACSPFCVRPLLQPA